MLTQHNNNQNLKQALSRFATGVTIVCAQHNNEHKGFTANSFCSVSLNPPLISVCLDNTANCLNLFLQCSHFTVSLLSNQQQQLSHKFAAAEQDRFANTQFQTTNSGARIISNCLAWFECLCHKRITIGDHTMLIGKVENFEYSQQSPLIYYRSDYKTQTL